MAIGAILLLLIATATILVYNKMVRNRNRTQEAWSIIDVFLRKRADLIPALVDVVKGYSEHEQTLLEEITRLRAAAATDNRQEQIDSANRLTKALGNLVVVVENYPEIKASEHFLNLQKQLAAIEGDLERARRYYNGTVREQNTCLESFPWNIIAALFRFRKGIFFSLATPDTTPP